MRQVATAARVREFLSRLGDVVKSPGTVYLVGGSTAVIEGWRASTIDIDLKLVPDSNETLRAIAELKNQLDVNVELASPDLFIPVPHGWESRSSLVGQFGSLTVRHYDLVSQALAKLERGHDRDISDVVAMVERGLVSVEDIRAAYEAIEPEIYRFPYLDPASFRRAVEDFLDSLAE